MIDVRRDHSAVITGGGTGIGKAVARRLISGGYSITLVGRRAAVLAATADELRELSDAPVHIHVADVGDADAPESVIAEHVRAVGGLDAIVTAAADARPQPFMDITAASWDEMHAVAVRGTALMAVAAAKHMVAAGTGRIVLISSTSGHHSEPDNADYSAAKAAVTSMAKSMAVDLGRYGVITNAIAPGWVRTPMTAASLSELSPEVLRRVNALGRVGSPEEIADVAWFLIDQAPAFLIGTTIYVDGGQTAAAPSA